MCLLLIAAPSTRKLVTINHEEENMSLKSVLHSIEEYQALTGQEGQHIDDLYLALKCSFIQSKYFCTQDKIRLKEQALLSLKQEEYFCQLTDNFVANDVIQSIKNHLTVAK